jgi:hypothetical protein
MRMQSLPGAGWKETVRRSSASLSMPASSRDLAFHASAHVSPRHGLLRRILGQLPESSRLDSESDNRMGDSECAKSGRRLFVWSRWHVPARAIWVRAAEVAVVAPDYTVFPYQRQSSWDVCSHPQGIRRHY